MNPVDTSFSLQSLDHSLNEINELQDSQSTPIKQIRPSNIECYLREKELELNSHPMNITSIYYLYHDPLVLALEKKSIDSIEYIVEVEDFRQKKDQHSNLMDQNKKCQQAKNEDKKINQPYYLDSVSRNLDFSL